MRADFYGRPSLVYALRAFARFKGRFLQPYMTAQQTSEATTAHVAVLATATILLFDYPGNLLNRCFFSCGDDFMGDRVFSGHKAGTA